MSGTLDQSSGAVEELVGYPFQADTAMRAAVFVEIDVLTLAHQEQ